MSRTSVLAALGVAAALLACTGAQGQCGPGGTCPDGQTCHLGYNVCYVAGAPGVTWASPGVGETLRGAGASVAGIIDFGGAFTAEISAGRPDQWQPLAVSAAGQFAATVALPPSNGEAQPLRVRTTETATGRVTVHSIYRPVDNVAPTLSFSEPSTRGTPTTVRLVASEPMSSSGSAPLAVPAGPPLPTAGNWNWDHTELRFEGLANDTTYTIDVPPGLADAAGNPSQARFTVTFTTEPATPATDLTVALPGLDLTDLEAASDGEGAVTVVLASAQGLVVWGGFDSGSGLWRTIGQATGSGLLRFQPISAPVLGRLWEDGRSRRANGMMMSRVAAGALAQALVYEDVYTDGGRGAFGALNPTGLSYLPGPGSCAEPPGPTTLEQDPASAAILLRAGALAPTPAPLPAAPAWTLFHSPLSGEYVGVDGGTVFRTPRRCACDAGCPVGPSQAVASGALASGRFSVADTPNDDRAYAYDTAAGRALTCMRGCGGGACANVGSESVSAGTELSVASANQGSLVLHAERSGGDVVLYRRDLQQGCGSGPTPAQELGRLTNGSSIRKFRPVMFGRKPGLLYLVTAGGPGVLRTYVP